MYIKVSEKLKAKYPHVQACSAINPFLFWGWSIIYNQQTLNYYDKHGPKIGWTPLFVTGKFTDGWLHIWCLGLRLWYGSGSCVFLWGGLLPHEVEPFNGEQWICVMSFLHQSVWEGAGMQPASSKIKITEPVKPLIIRIPGHQPTLKTCTESSGPKTTDSKLPWQSLGPLNAFSWLGE